MRKLKFVRFSGEESVSDRDALIPQQQQQQQHPSTPTKSILLDKFAQNKLDTSFKCLTEEVKQSNQSTEQEQTANKDFVHKGCLLEILTTSQDQRPSLHQDNSVTVPQRDIASTSTTKHITTKLEANSAPPRRLHSAPTGYWSKDYRSGQWFCVSNSAKTPQSRVEVRTYCLKSTQPLGAVITTRPREDRTCGYLQPSSLKPASSQCVTAPRHRQQYTSSSFGLFSGANYTSSTTKTSSAGPTPSSSISSQASGVKSSTTTMSQMTGRGFQCLGRLHEKEELQTLNDRLSHYIKHVQDLRQNGGSDLASFLESIKILENELVGLKAMYERELDGARRQAEELSREKNLYVLEANKTKSLASDLENRLALESDKGRRTQDEINAMQRVVMMKDQELDKAKLALQGPLHDLEQLRKEYEAAIRDLENYKRRYETEILQRQAAEEKGHQLQQQLDFKTQLCDKEKQEMSGRLNAATATILSLEAKIRELSQSDDSLAAALQKVREAAAEELRVYQQDSEETFNSSLMEVKAQLEETGRRLEGATNENAQLNSEVGDLTSKLRSQEGQIGSLQHQCQSLDQMLQKERLAAQERISSLERQLQQLQDTLVTRMQEFNTSREAHLPLKAEIEAFKVLLAEEEKRLKIAESCGMTGCSMPIAPYEIIHSVGTGPALTSLTSRGVSEQVYSTAPGEYKPPPACTRSFGASITNQPLGPIRARSAPDMDGGLAVSSRSKKKSHRISSDSIYSFTTGDLKVLEVHPKGKYIRLINTSPNKDAEIGQYMVQQNVGGQPVAIFRFPQRSRFYAGQTVTVWSGSNDHKLHQPPADYVFKEQTKWGTGPECTTILCKPNGQAVAWMTAAHRFTGDPFADSPLPQSISPPASQQADEDNIPEGMQEELTEFNMDVNAAPAPPVYLKREKEGRPSFHPPRHPYGCQPPAAVHPHTGQGRVLTFGNDNSTVSRQSRIQTQRPDPIPGAPYAGASAQKMGSALLKRYQSPCTIRNSGQLANKSECVTSPPPSAFQKPHGRFNTGLSQVQSQNNTEFNPPMPRPPLFSSW